MTLQDYTGPFTAHPDKDDTIPVWFIKDSTGKEVLDIFCMDPHTAETVALALSKMWEGEKRAGETVEEAAMRLFPYTPPLNKLGDTVTQIPGQKNPPNWRKFQKIWNIFKAGAKWASTTPVPEQPAANDLIPGWWCARCKCVVEPRDVTYDETHDVNGGGCGYSV